MRGYCVLAGIVGAACAAGAAEWVANPGFETVTNGQSAAEWSWWTREKNAGRVEVSTERHSGERAVHIVHDGAKDWNLTNARKTQVTPGE